MPTQVLQTIPRGGDWLVARDGWFEFFYSSRANFKLVFWVSSYNIEERDDI